jgi:hypothetical protein
MQQVDLAAAQYLFGVRLLYDYGLCQISICRTLGLYGLRGKMCRSVPTSLSMPRKASRSFFIITQIDSTGDYSLKYGKNIIKPTLSGTGRQKYKTIFSKI